MDKDYLIKLTLAVHQTSEWWPESNLLKFKLRNLANQVLAGFILLSYKNPASRARSQTFKNVRLLCQALEEARSQKLVTRNEFLLFQKEYKKMGEEIKGSWPVSRSFPKTKEDLEKQEPAETDPEELNQRQKKILEILKDKKTAQVWELKEFFSGISKRTLRRDLEGLLKKELIERSGKWNKVFYVLVRGRTD